MFYESLRRFTRSRDFRLRERNARMSWVLSRDRQSGSKVWVKKIDDVHLSVYSTGDAQYPWKWVVQYGIVTVTGNALTARAAKMRASRTARQYVIQGELWPF